MSAKNKFHVVQLRQLLDGKANSLQQSLETLARGRYRRIGDCLKLIRAYQQLRECGDKSLPSRIKAKAQPLLTELRFILEQAQQPKTAIKLLQKLETEENQPAIAWANERLTQRNQKHLENLAERAAKALKDFSPTSHHESLELLTDAPLRKQHQQQLKRMTRELARQLDHVDKDGVTAEQLAELRELLRRCRFLLELSGQLFENSLPFDARLLDECREKLKKADQWQTATRLLHELEPEFNARPRPMAREWLKLHEAVHEGAQKRSRKLAKSMRKDDSHWAGLRFALNKLTEAKK
ncbi:MAG TPA: hypothetical protein VGH19_21205 [Verrucomicrobiae bacterium]